VLIDRYWWENQKGKKRPRHRGVDNIKMDLGEIEWGEWTGFVELKIRTSGELL
jgi:hypothetical protein